MTPNRVSVSSLISKIKTSLDADVIGKFGKINFIHFKKPSIAQSSSVVEDLTASINSPCFPKILKLDYIRM